MVILCVEEVYILTLLLENKECKGAHFNETFSPEQGQDYLNPTETIWGTMGEVSKGKEKSQDCVELYPKPNKGKSFFFNHKGKMLQNITQDVAQ